MSGEAAAAGGGAGSVRARLRGHAGLAGVLLLALPLLFAQLGAGALWSDEGDTAVYARSILRHGLPTAWDGQSFIDSDAGRRLSPGLIMVGTPWLPYYVTAASFALLGESVLAARLPFALAALASVALLYRLVWRATGDRRSALVAALLLLLSVQFLLYARECRHYALNVLLSLTLLLAFLRLCEGSRGVGFVATAVALFHVHPLPAAASLSGLGGLALLHPGYRPVRGRLFWRLVMVAPLTLPWMAWSWSGWDTNSSLLTRPAELPARALQFGWEASVAVPWLAWLGLLPWALPRLAPRDRAGLLLVASPMAGYAVLTPLALDTHQLWMVGLRYLPALIALAAGASAVLAVRATRGNPAGLAVIVALLGFTHLGGNALPWLLLPPVQPPEPERAAAHVPVGTAARLFRSEWPGFLRELQRPDPGTVAWIAAALQRAAAPGDRLITNYAWEPLTFHTGLPLALTVLPGNPLAEAVRSAGLPGYVYGVEGARWLVWRWPWEGYLNYRFQEVASEIRRRGGEIERVQRFPETFWENRPELHFHRFPGEQYVYPVWNVGKLPEAELFRIRWPGDEGAGGAAP